nr:ketopantoate reductase C-terminal domain-containing protein [Pseudomonas sp. DP16D-R1]
MTRKLGKVKTSMLQDVEAHKPVEIEAILGALVAVANLTGASMPRTRPVYALARMRAKALGLLPGAKSPPSLDRSGALDNPEDFINSDQLRLPSRITAKQLAPIILSTPQLSRIISSIIICHFRQDPKWLHQHSPKNGHQTYCLFRLPR